MMNYNEYSPIQLVLRTNPNLPSISSNKLPAMEDIEVSDKLRKHLNTLHAARHATSSQNQINEFEELYDI